MSWLNHIFFELQKFNNVPRLWSSTVNDAQRHQDKNYHEVSLRKTNTDGSKGLKKLLTTIRVIRAAANAWQILTDTLILFLRHFHDISS